MSHDNRENNMSTLPPYHLETIPCDDDARKFVANISGTEVMAHPTWETSVWLKPEFGDSIGFTAVQARYLAEQMLRAADIADDAAAKAFDDSLRDALSGPTEGVEA
jgi:hypothetical protein